MTKQTKSEERLSDYEDAFIYQCDSLETYGLIITILQEARNETLISISQQE